MTCLEDTYNYLSKLSTQERDNFTIIHAIIERKRDKLRHPHAVIYNKITGEIYEVSNDFKDNNIIVPFAIWIRLGKVSNIKQYTFLEMSSLLLKTKKWDFYHLN